MHGHTSNSRRAAVAAIAALGLVAGPAATVGVANAGDNSPFSVTEMLPGDTAGPPFWPYETGVLVGTSETYVAEREDGSYYDPSIGRRVSGAGASPGDELQASKAASARYHSVERALEDGYRGADEPCIASPDGAMGIHYVNGLLIGNDSIDLQRPEILLYAPGEDGSLKLVAVEYFKVDADQDLATADDRPTLFGQPFDGPMTGHNATMPVHYDLHVWFWKPNPSGMFAPFNPTFSC